MSNQNTFASQFHWGTTGVRRLIRSTLAQASWGLLLLLIAGTAVRADDGGGVQARIGHIEGQGIPQVQPVTPIELFPYYEFDQQLLFNDSRFVITNSGGLGGNLGFGYRFFEPETDRVYGGSLWYDIDNTRDLLFQQVGLSLETYGSDFDVRGNAYLPVGPQTHQDSLYMVPGSLAFSGQNLVYTQNRGWYAAMKGVDLEAGIPVPGSIAESIDLRVYGGGYFYHNSYHDIPGVSTRARAAVLPGLDLELQVTYDSFFETRAFAGISWTLGPLHYSKFQPGDTLGRLGEHTTRNYTVVATHQRQNELVIARNPKTNQAYRFAHVSGGSAPVANGSFESPFHDMASAQALGADVVFVHSGTVLTGSAAQLVMNPGERILGEGGGIRHWVQVPELGLMAMPTAAGAYGNWPVLQNAPGDAITLASGSEINGFQVTNAAGSGLVANGISNASVHNLAIDGAGGWGIQTLNTSGRMDFSNLSVRGAAAGGILMQGGSATTNVSGLTRISQSGGNAISLIGLDSAGQVLFDDISISERGAMGVSIANLKGSASFQGTTGINNELLTTQSAVDVRDSSGSVNFNRLIASDTRGAAGVNLQNNTGITTISTLNLTGQNNTGVRAYDAGKLRINPAGTNGVDLNRGGTISVLNGTAFDAEKTSLEVNMQSISSSGAPQGVRLVNDTGSFVVWGNGNSASGGTIANGGTGFFIDGMETVSLNSMRFDGNGTAIDSEDLTMLVLHDVQVVNSTGAGVDATNVQGLVVVNSLFQDNAGPNIRAEFNALQAYTYTFQNSYFLNKTTDSVLLTNTAGGAGSSLSLTAKNNEFNTTQAGTTGLRVAWNGSLSGTVDSNYFQGTGGGNTGFAYMNTGAASSNLALTNNDFVLMGGNGTGTYLNTTAATQVSAIGNAFDMSGSGGVGLRATAVAPSFTMTSNAVKDSTGGVTGFLFDSLTGPGTMTFNNNQMNLANSSLVDRGVVFSSINNTLQLFGNQNNVISGADTGFAFWVPQNATTGRVLVNGQYLP
ncbi:MAG TPA: hypothetical protein DDY91_17035 [Planctomycetaceae bacterium]|nr:hypothetical protein [Planctomycetaceae bacterium]